MHNSNTRVLIVDDQDEIHIDFREMLSTPNKGAASDDLAAAFLPVESQSNTDYLPSFELSHASSGDEAYQIVKAAKEANRPFAAAYVDIRMPPGMDGIETVRRIREFEKNLEIVMMTAYTDKPLHEIITNMELLHKLLYIRKPVTREEIQQITLSLVEKWNLEQEALQHQQALSVSHQRLEAVLDATGDAIGVLDADSRLLFANQQYCQLFDISERELNQISPDELNARVKKRFRKVPLSETASVGPFEDFTNILEEIGDADPEESRLFYRFTTSLTGDEDTGTDKVISYHDLSKDVELQRMTAEVMSLRAELEKSYAFDEIIGKSKSMQQVFSQIQTAAEGTISVLIQGDSGTGKELVAKSIHANSPRKNAPFVAVNCAAIPETLIESELFGHERGLSPGQPRDGSGSLNKRTPGPSFSMKSEICP